MNRQKWTKEHQEFLEKYYPHVGSEYCAKQLNRSKNSILRRACDMGLIKIEPKEKRLCAECLINFQMPLIKKGEKGTNHGKLCKQCGNKRHNKNARLRPERSIKQQLEKHLYNCFHRSIRKGLLPVTITIEDLLEKWNQQQGKCYYSGEQMTSNKYGVKRSPYTVSMDQLIPKAGYTKENIVLCCWFANAGKDENSEQEYIEFCKKVVNYQINKEIK